MDGVWTSVRPQTAQSESSWGARTAPPNYSLLFIWFTFHFFPVRVRHSLPGFPFISCSLNFSLLPTKAPKPSRLKLLLWSCFLRPETDGHTNLHSSRSHGLNVKLSADLKNNATSRTPLLKICIDSSAKAEYQIWSIWLNTMRKYLFLPDFLFLCLAHFHKQTTF